MKRGRGTDKVYGCLFTCFTSRAVHIEDVVRWRPVPLYKVSVDSSQTSDAPRKSGVTMLQTSLQRTKKFAIVSVNGIRRT